VDITDTWEPLQEGLNRLETTRHVSVIMITLSTEPLDVKASGYQPPLPPEMVKLLQEPQAPRRVRGGSLDACAPGPGGRGGGLARAGSSVAFQAKLGWGSTWALSGRSSWFSWQAVLLELSRVGARACLPLSGRSSWFSWQAVLLELSRVGARACLPLCSKWRCYGAQAVAPRSFSLILQVYALNSAWLR
jgi:hypothetical protein